MSETIKGGAYLAADGKTWHDADGRPLSADVQAQAEALAAEKTARANAMQQQEAATAQLQNAAAVRVLLGSAAPAPGLDESPTKVGKKK